jgi:hypothetical protein
MQIESNTLYTVETAAAELSIGFGVTITEASIVKLLKDGTIPSIKLGKTWLFTGEGLLSAMSGFSMPFIGQQCACAEEPPVDE